MPSIAITRPYEAVYILDPDLGEEQITAVVDRYRNLVATNGGTVGKIDVWERRKLAYEVKGRNEGIYVVMQFTGEATVEAELRRIFQISEDQIRYMIVKQEDGAAPALPVIPQEAAAAPAAPPVAQVQATESAPSGETPAVAAEPTPAAVA